MNIRLPKYRYDRITWVLFLFIVAMIWMMARARKKETFAQGVMVSVKPLASGDKLISERDVKQALLMGFGNTLEGTELANLEVERMERVLEEDPFVKDADTYLDQNNQLHVSIEQREPILRVLDSHGSNYYLDANGKKMPPSKNFAARVLVATGNITPYTPEFLEKRRNNLKDLFNITKTILADEFLSNFIQQIHVNNAGEFVLVPLIGDQKIILGSSRRLTDKLDRLKIFYKQAMPYEGWRKYETINLKYNGQVVCKK
jgi:cell division protein FtsQ